MIMNARSFPTEAFSIKFIILYLTSFDTRYLDQFSQLVKVCTGEVVVEQELQIGTHGSSKLSKDLKFTSS